MKGNRQLPLAAVLAPLKVPVPKNLKQPPFWRALLTVVGRDGIVVFMNRRDGQESPLILTLILDIVILLRDTMTLVLTRLVIATDPIVMIRFTGGFGIIGFANM